MGMTLSIDLGQAAITAQIAITALSLSSLSMTHWIVRGLSVFSLVSALMAVYYATTQHKALGRLLTAKQVRGWIRGASRVPEHSRILPSLAALFASHRNLIAFTTYVRALHDVYANFTYGPPTRYHLCDPDDLKLEHINTGDSDRINKSFIRLCFLPGVASVITMSAPQVLLSASPGALLIALGVYLGFIWTRNLDTDAGLYDSRNVFIMYIVGLVVCALVYSISQLIRNEDSKSEHEVVQDYLRSYVHAHPEFLQRLNIMLESDDGKLMFARVSHVTNGPV